MTVNSKRILLFAACFAFLILAPPFLGIPLPAYPLMHWADALDLLTPLVLIPLYWMLFSGSGRAAPPRSLVLIFLVLGALWTLGHGMHLSANSISNLLGPGSSAVHQLVHFYDEVLSHYLWHIAIVGLSVLLLAGPAMAQPQAAPVPWGIILPSALLYGFTYFAAVNEGGTVPFGLPAAALIVLALLLRRRTSIRSDSLTAFFFFGYAIALILFAVWFGYWGGFPEFSATGLI
jgi:hypothetical protein